MTGPAAELAACLARAEAARDGGRTAEGLQAAEQAWTLARAHGDATARLDAGRLLLHFRYRSGALWALVDAGIEVLPLMRHGNVARTELIDTLRLVVLGAADVGRFEEAMALGHEAHRLAQELGDRGRLSLAINALGCVYERIGDPWHAERLLLDALGLAEEADARHAAFVALNNLAATMIGHSYLLQGSAPEQEARGVLLRGLPHAERALSMALETGDEFQLAFVHGNLGEVLVLLGRLDEARVELDAAQAGIARGGFEAQSWRVGCTVGELLLRRGDADAAWRHLQGTWQACAGAGAHNTQLRLHHVMWRTARALGQPEQALHHLERYVHLEQSRLLLQLRGRSQLFVTTVEAEQVRLEAHRAGERARHAEVSARVDPLTSLGNRRELQQRWPQLAEPLQAQHLPLALAMLDIDHFKQVNDRFGHAAGDAVLVALAAMLRDAAGDGGLAVRLGGEELLLVLPGCDGTTALQRCEQLRQRISAHGWELLAPGLQVAVSIGVASSPPYELRTLLARADDALYAAKRSGRDRVHAG
ncbi:MAG: GGDEF domain-containing protein [Rubrivivax sp.]